jgi:uncharacterized peroxidase-related enzyme
MPYIAQIADEGAQGEVADLFDADRGQLGDVANYTRVFGHRPGVFLAWKQLNGAIKATMDRRRYELATIAAARRLRSSYCMLAHGRVLLDDFMDADTLRRVATDHHSAGLDRTDIALMDLAEKVADDATAVGQEDVDRLRALGLSDVDILDVILAAAARCFFSKVLDATGTRADASYANLDPGVRDALTVGRPIADP